MGCFGVGFVVHILLDAGGVQLLDTGRQGPRMSEYTHALAVDEDGQMVCLVCAYEHAVKGGYPRLYWMANEPQEVAACTACSVCGQSCGRQETEDAAEKITAFLQRNDSTHGENK